MRNPISYDKPATILKAGEKTAPRVDILTGKKLAHDAPDFFGADTLKSLKIPDAPANTGLSDARVTPKEFSTDFDPQAGDNALPLIEFTDAIGAGDNFFSPSLDNLSSSGEFGGSVDPEGEVDLNDMKRILRKILKTL